MSTHRAIPAVAAVLHLVTTGGCTPDPMFGTWDGTEARVDGETYALPIADSYLDGTVTIETSVTWTLTFEEPATGELTFVITTLAGEDESVLRAPTTLSGISRGVGLWDLELDTDYDDALICTAEKSELDCTDGSDPTSGYHFVRADP